MNRLLTKRRDRNELKLENEQIVKSNSVGSASIREVKKCPEILYFYAELKTDVFTNVVFPEFGKHHSPVVEVVYV